MALLIVKPLQSGGHLGIAQNAMPTVFFGHSTMPGIPENQMVDIKITNLLQLCTKWH